MKTCCTLFTPLGHLSVAATRKGIIYCAFTPTPPNEGDHSDKGREILEQCKVELAEYFEGYRATFTVPVDPQGTVFQQSVWKALQHVPYGKTASYSDIATAIQNPKAVRAVGRANNQNPVSIIIPCHRIIGKDGSLVGYGGGLDKKQRLLQLESQNKHE